MADTAPTESTDSPNPPASTEEPAEQATRGNDRRPRDMIISLAVLFLPVVLLVGGYQVVSGRTGPVAVDPQEQIAAAQADGLPVTGPQPLGDDWTTVSAVYDKDDQTLRLGYVTPDGDSVQVVQSTVPAERLLPAELGDGADTITPAGRETISDVEWQRYGTPGEPALVRLSPELTVVVYGGAAPDTLRQLAGATAPG